MVAGHLYAQSIFIEDEILGPIDENVAGNNDLDIYNNSISAIRVTVTIRDKVVNTSNIPLPEEIESIDNSNITGNTGKGIMVEKGQIGYYPNPAQGMLTISLPTAMDIQVTLVDMSGRIVLNKAMQEGEESLDIKAIAAGIYYIQINTPMGTKQDKVMIL